MNVAILWLIHAALAGPIAPGDPETGSPAPASVPTDEQPSRADDTPPPTEVLPADESGTFQAVLRAAKRRYFDGESEAAKGLLLGLRDRIFAGEDPGGELAHEAMTYLGVVHFKLDEEAEAKQAFRWILEQDPDALISPYHHRIDVVNLFHVVRAEVAAQRNTVPPPELPAAELGRPPLWHYLPLGIPQFGQGRGGAGVLFGGLQATFGLASIALYSSVDRNNDDFGLPEEQVRRQALTTQWPVTIAFYGTWALSIADANRYRRRRASTLSVGPVGAQGAPGVRVHSRF